jgi:hypothetical protein
MSTLLPPLRRKDVWNFDLDRKIFVEIVHWGVDCGDASTKPRNNGKGTWNYYITLWERHLPPDIFKSIWLENMETNWGSVTHDYDCASFSQVNWHGGTTFYDKLGQVEGHRGVKIGCDYEHPFDAERGFDYSLEDVALEALETATQLKALYQL